MTSKWVSADGDTIGGALKDGSELRLYPVDAATPLATAARPAPFWRFDPAVNPDQPLLADRVAADRVVVRRAPSLEPVRQITTPPVPTRPPAQANAAEEAARNYDMFFDSSDRLVTIVGHQVSVWDPSSGERVAQLDLVALGHAKSEQIVHVSGGPDPDRLALAVEGQPDLRFVDVPSGRQVDTTPVGADVRTAFLHR